MFFRESEAIATEYLELRELIEQVDEQLAQITSSGALRPTILASALGADVNQVRSILELLAQHGVLAIATAVECDDCCNLMPEADFRQALEAEDEFECSSCGRRILRSDNQVTVYHLKPASRSLPKPTLIEHTDIGTSGAKPLSARAQDALVAMLQLDATDPDKRKSTDEIAARARGAVSDANSFKSVMSDLNTRKLVSSKIGRDGGYWLTGAGIARATRLRDRYSSKPI